MQPTDLQSIQRAERQIFLPLISSFFLFCSIAFSPPPSVCLNMHLIILIRASYASIRA